VKVRNKDDNEESINHSVRLLGRRGVMNVDLVAGPEDMVMAIPAFDSVLTEFSYFTGHSYAEWKPGDKVAEYGLTALVAGGAGLAAAKLGLFGKMWKWIIGLLMALKKFVIVVIVAIGAFFRKLFSRGSKAEAVPRPAAKTPAAGPVKAPSGAYKAAPRAPPPAASPANERPNPNDKPRTPPQ
jgi:uncharacterized membrane-anchored protein